MWKKRGTLRKSVSRLNVPHIHLRFHNASTSSTGAGESLYFDDDGQPVFTYMVSVPHANKHLIKFPIALDYTTLRSWIGNSTTPPQTVLLKADTGDDFNLMNRQTFHQLFGKAKDLLQLTPIRMENYGNSAVKVLGMFYVFLRWKDKVYKQLFYITDCDRSPNLLSRDACYTLGVLKPCYTVESGRNSTKCEHSFLHQKMNGPEKKLSDNSTKCSLTREQLQGGPLTKQDILETYAYIFTGIGKFPGLPYKFQLKPYAKLLGKHQGKCLYTCKMHSMRKSGIWKH